MFLIILAALNFTGFTILAFIDENQRWPWTAASLMSMNWFISQIQLYNLGTV